MALMLKWPRSANMASVPVAQDIANISINRSTLQINFLAVLWLTHEPEEKPVCIHTCDAEDGAPKRDPGLLAVPPEVIDDVHGVEGFEDGGVMHGEVVHPDGCDEEESHRDDERKGVADLVSPILLHREEEDEDGHRDPHHLHCSKTTTRIRVAGYGRTVSGRCN
jgi:hypothetical protein